MRALTVLRGRNSCGRESESRAPTRGAFRHLLLALLCLLAFGPAAAQETVDYTYDGRGRLIEAVHNNVFSCFSYDAAGNRQTLTNASGSDCASSGGPAPSFSISDASGNEGSAITFTVTRSGDTTGTDTVQYATANGTATAGSDYTAKSLTTLTFNPGVATQPISVATLQDTLVEGNETFLVNLSNPSSGASISESQGVGTIIDDDSSTQTLTVNPSSLCCIHYYVGSPYSVTFTASNGNGSYTFQKSSGTLPPGLSLNSSTGVLSGTPTTAGTYGFTITATDTADDTGSRTYSLTIYPVFLHISPTTLPGGSTGTTYNQTFSASGGFGPYSYSRSAGTLPTGLALNSSTGVLSGTPSTAGTYSFTIRADDSGGDSGSMSYSVTIASPGGACGGVSYSVNDVEVTEGSPLIFTVTKAGTTSSSCSISYATADGTARAGTNYVAASGTLTFTSSQPSLNITVTTMGGHILDGRKNTMYLNLSNPSAGGGISDSQGIGTLDSDGSICKTCGLSAGSTTTDPTLPPGE